MRRIPRIESSGVSRRKRSAPDPMEGIFGQPLPQAQPHLNPDRKTEQAEKRQSGPNIMPREKWDTLGGGDMNQLLDAFRPEPPQQAQRQARSAKASALQEAIGQLGSVVGSAMGAPATTPTMRHRDHLSKYEQMLANYEDQKRAHEMLQLQQTIGEDRGYRDYVTGRQAEERGIDQRWQEIEDRQDHELDVHDVRYKHDEKREAARLKRAREEQAALNRRAELRSGQEEEKTTILQDPQTGKPLAHLDQADHQWVRNRVLNWALGPGREHLTDMDLLKVDDESVDITERDIDRWMHMYFDKVPEVRQRFEMDAQQPQGPVLRRRREEGGPPLNQQLQTADQRLTEQQRPAEQPREQGQSRTFNTLPRQLKDSIVSRLASDEAARITDKDKIRELLKAQDAQTIEQILEDYGL